MSETRTRSAEPKEVEKSGRRERRRLREGEERGGLHFKKGGERERERGEDGRGGGCFLLFEGTREPEERGEKARAPVGVRLEDGPDEGVGEALPGGREGRLHL